MRPYRLLLITVYLAAALACDDDAAPPPGGTGTGPDTDSPEPINDLALNYDSLSNSVTFSWTARRDDDVRDRADHYDIRYGGSFPFDWEQSTRVADPPEPLVAGSAQEFQLPDPVRGRDVYASIRALDAAGNISPAGDVAYVRVPGFTFVATCTHAFTTDPVAGLDVTVTGRGVQQLTTGADGRFIVEDLAAGTLEVDITGAYVPPFHAFHDQLVVDDDARAMYAMIPFEQPESPAYPSVLALLYEANFSTGALRIVKRWHQYPVPWYAPDFVNINGVNYRDIAIRAAEQWNTRIGFQMFAPTTADPAVGVLFQFLPRSTMGIVNGVTYRTSDAEGYPVHDRIDIVDDFAVSGEETLFLIMVHELGHTIRLNHLPTGFIMSASNPLPPDITNDEVKMVQLMLAVPNGTILDKYDTSAPVSP